MYRKQQYAELFKKKACFEGLREENHSFLRSIDWPDSIGLTNTLIGPENNGVQYCGPTRLEYVHSNDVSIYELQLTIYTDNGWKTYTYLGHKSCK